MKRKKLHKRKKDSMQPVKETNTFHGIKKVEWQVLHFLHEKAWLYKEELIKMMKPFSDRSMVNKILSKFKITCVIFDPEEQVTLTSNGIDLYKSLQP